MDDKTKLLYKPEWNWYGRSLDNYKNMHAKLAKEKGVSVEFQACKTLTQARKVLFGFKKGNKK